MYGSAGELMIIKRIEPAWLLQLERAVSHKSVFAK
jgi:hypothetical protein